MNIDIILKNEIIDVEVNNGRCIVNRLIEQKGDVLWFFVKHGKIKISEIKIYPLTESK